MTAGHLRVPALVLVGSIMMQLAWILAVPAFGGSDEFDHVYRAAAVGHGEWVAEPTDATDGTGAILTVPRATVEAATPICEDLKYTDAVDCRPQDDSSEEMTPVGSAAGRYNPVFYAAVGYPSRLLDGYPSVYAMRVMTAVISSLLLALASLALTVWSRSRWPLVGLLVAWTPVAVYSTAMVAPNGPEMAAGALVWCALAGLARWPLSPRQARALVLLATPGAIVLALFRSLGPLWLVLIVGSCVLLGGRQMIANLRGQRRLVVGTAAGAAIATFASGVWVLQMRSLALRSEGDVPGDPLVEALKAIPLWLFQSIAVFPTRAQFAPALVYDACLLVGVLLALGAVLNASARMRLTMLAILVATIAIPVAASLMTYSDYGIAWQGRYTLPFSLGFIVVAAAALDGRPPPQRLAVPSLVGAAIALAAAHSVGVVNVLLNETAKSVLADTSAWTPPPAWVVAAMVVLAWGPWVAAVRSASHRELTEQKVRQELEVVAA